MSLDSLAESKIISSLNRTFDFFDDTNNLDLVNKKSSDDEQLNEPRLKNSRVKMLSRIVSIYDHVKDLPIPGAKRKDRGIAYLEKTKKGSEGKDNLKNN